MGETFADVQKDIARFAAEAFVDHVLTVEGPNEWRCGKAGTVIMSFRILCRTGMVAVWGDLGEWVLRHGDKDSVRWLRGAVRSPDYLLEKVKAGEKERFYVADAEKLLADPETDEYWGEGVVAKVRESLESRWGDEMTRDEWYEAWSDAGADEPPGADYPREAALWLVEMLRKFVELEAALPQERNPASPLDLAVVDEIEAAERPENRYQRPATIPTVRRHRCLSSASGRGTRAIYYLTVEYPEVARG